MRYIEKIKCGLDFRGVSLDKIKGLEIHNLRKHIKYKISSTTIDGVKSEKTHLNKTIVEAIDYKKYVENTLSENKIEGFQKKSHLFTSWVIHAGNKDCHLENDKAQSFFEDSVQFIEKKFGKVVSAVAHYDEATPHVHIVVSNFNIKDNGKKYWSLKTAFNFEKLKTKTEIANETSKLHQDFYTSVSSKYGFAKPEIGGTKGYKNQVENILSKINKQIYSQKEILNSITKLKFEELKDLITINTYNLKLYKDSTSKNINIKETYNSKNDHYIHIKDLNDEMLFRNKNGEEIKVDEILWISNEIREMFQNNLYIKPISSVKQIKERSL